MGYVRLTVTASLVFFRKSTNICLFPETNKLSRLTREYLLILNPLYCYGCLFTNQTEPNIPVSNITCVQYICIYTGICPMGLRQIL